MSGLNLPASRLILLAALAGVVAGGIAVYVGGGGSGNNAGTAAETARAEADTACAAKTDRATSIGETARGEVAAMLAASPPKAMAPLAFNDGDGQPMDLDAFAGRTLLINLWATWCAPCRAEMPALDKLEQQMGGESFEVVAINLDTGGDEKPRAFLEEIGVSALGRYRDASMGVFNQLKREGLVVGLPATLLVDGDGCLLAHMNGPAEWASEDAIRLIETALDGAPSG